MQAGVQVMKPLWTAQLKGQVRDCEANTVQQQHQLVCIFGRYELKLSFTPLIVARTTCGTMWCWMLYQLPQHVMCTRGSPCI